MERGEPRPSIIVLAHSRHAHLERTLDALKNAHQFSHHRLVVVVDGRWPKTEQVVARNVLPDVHIVATHGEHESPRVRIRKNLALGLNFAFEAYSSPYAIVVEDDIVASDDLLTFVSASFEKWHNDPLFRAINAFSNSKPSTGASPGDCIRVNYGVGWGWALPKSTYKKIRKLLEMDSDEHWDSLIEPYMRTGFVICPTRSRVVNIGFDGSGAHSGSARDVELGKQMAISVLQPGEWHSSASNLTCRPFLSDWRDDVVTIDRLDARRRVKIYFLGWIAWSLSNLIQIVERDETLGRAGRLRATRKKILRTSIPALRGHTVQPQASKFS
mgnify:CR=1 FL=1